MVDGNARQLRLLARALGPDADQAGSGTCARRRALARLTPWPPVRPSTGPVDLVGARKGEKVHVDVPVHVVGEAFVETVVSLENNTVELAVEATHIPERLDVSVDGLKAGTQIHASDLVLPKGAELLTDGDVLVVNITQAITAEELEAELAAEVAANLPEEAIVAAEAEAHEAAAAEEAPAADADKGDKGDKA